MNVTDLRNAQGNASALGNKAAILGDLQARGYRVPAGFVILRSVQSRMWSRVGPTAPSAHMADGEDGFRKALLEAGWPQDVRADIEEGVLALGRGPLVVRSSALDEDGRDRSFAGQYVSVLDVRGSDEVLSACIDCWASERSASLIAYGGGATPAGMSLIVQNFVESDWAGVALTTNPIDADRSEVIIESLAGPAVEVCAGQRNPVRHVIDKLSGQVSVVSAPCASPVMPAILARAVASCAIGIEHLLGMPVDLEWALEHHSEEVTVLQARPVSGQAAGGGPVRDAAATVAAHLASLSQRQDT